MNRIVSMREKSAYVPTGERGDNSLNGSQLYLKNVSLKFVSGAIGFIFSIVSSMIVARALGVEGNGTATILLLIPSTITWFINLGIGRANGYLLGANKHTLQILVGNSLSLVFIISLITGTVGWIAMPLFLQYFSNSNINISMLALASLIVPLTLFEGYLAGLLLGLERIFQLSLVTIVRFFSLLVLNAVLVLVFGLGVWGVLLSAIVVPSICIAAYSYFLRHDATIRPGFDIRALKAALTFGLQGHVGNVLHFLNLRLDVFMVSFFVGVRSVGLYTVATALSEFLTYFSNAFSFVLFPRTASSDPETANQFTPRVARLSIFITILAAFGMFLASRSLITIFYSAEFLPSIHPLWILLPGIVSLGYAGVIYSDLSGRGKPYFSTYGALVSLIVTVMLDCLLIPKWDIVGAATASSAAYTTNAVMALYFYHRVTGTRPAELLLIRKSDIKLGFDTGYKMALSLNRAFHAWWSLED